MNFQMVYQTLRKDLDSIEKKIEEVLTSTSPTLQDTSVHYLRSGGKRLRPMLVLLSAKFGDATRPIIKDVAVALELIHMASLIHDDVIDDAETRRGRLTVKEKWDNKVAMYTGDYILAKSLELLARIENTTAHKIFAETMVQLSIGEIEQIRDKYDFNQTVTSYFRRIKRKTALLIAACCQLGAMAAGADKFICEKLYQFGYFAGMAFQITDDILDFTSTDEKLGKPAGGDLLQGNITLPVLFALKNKDLKEKIVKVHEHMDREELDEIIQGIKESGAIDQSFAVSDHYLKKALQQLEELPDNDTKLFLKAIVNFIRKRHY